MPYKYRRDCPVYNKPELLYLSDHLSQVHNLTSEERKPWLKAALFPLGQWCFSPYLTLNLWSMNHPPEIARPLPKRRLNQPRCNPHAMNVFPVNLIINADHDEANIGQKKEGVNRYAERLQKHLKDLSEETAMDLMRQWRFYRSIDTGRCSSSCPCGKLDIRYLYYIKNRINSNTTFVGSECIHKFSREMSKVIYYFKYLISSGVKGRYKGEGSKGKRFELDEGSKLVTHRFLLDNDGLTLPLYKNDKEQWEIQIICWRNDLIEDCNYKLKLEAVNENVPIQLTMVKDCNTNV